MLLSLISGLQTFAVACDTKQTFFGIPVWYKYLQVSAPNGGPCSVVLANGDLTKTALLIGLGIVDILLHIAGILAVGFVIYGGFLYIISQGEPDKTKKAKDTILNALIGIVIVLIAAPVVSFIGNKLGAGLL